MVMRRLSLALFLSAICTFAHVDAHQPPEQTRVMRALNYLYNGVTNILLYPFKAIGSATVDGAWEKIREKIYPPQLKISGSAHPPDEKDPNQMKEVVASFFEALKDATDPHDKRATGAQFIKNLFTSGAIAVGDLYNPDGEGREALRKIIVTINEYINEDGAIKSLVEDMRNLAVDEVRVLFERIEELNLDGGAATKAVKAAAHNMRHGVDEVGEALDQTSQKLVRNVLIGGVLLMSSWFLWRQYDRNLRTPTLVLETSYKNYFQRIAGIFSTSIMKEKPRMLLSSDLAFRLNSVALAARTIHEKIVAGNTHIRYRNLLLWGPPGTGKTMFARMVAQYSGMDYVIMSGSSFSQFRHGEGITHMNKLFEWANNSTTGGLILFIDEAEAFLGGRSGADVASESYQLLTNFLNLTGERSGRIMLIFGTNHPEALDGAMKRRIDDAIEIPLPAFQERFGILQLYRDKLMLDPEQNSPEFIESVQNYLHDAIIAELATKTEGLSGGELEGVINTILSDSAIASDGLVSPELINAVVGYALQKHASFMQGFGSSRTE